MPALLVFPICVHICVCSFIFHFNYGADNSSVCANSTQPNTLSPSVFWMVKSHFMRCVDVHHVFHVSAVHHSTAFSSSTFSSDHQGATKSILGSVCLQSPLKCTSKFLRSEEINSTSEKFLKAYIPHMTFFFTLHFASLTQNK